MSQARTFIIHEDETLDARGSTEDEKMIKNSMDAASNVFTICPKTRKKSPFDMTTLYIFCIMFMVNIFQALYLMSLYNWWDYTDINLK